MIQNRVWDIEGFQRHCQVAALVWREFGLDPHTRHHISDAIREASNKVSTVRGSDDKARAPYMSVAAGQQMESGDFASLKFDHAVPIGFINEKVLALSEPSAESIQAIVLEWTLLSVITEEEHERLAQAGLAEKMPDDWDRKNLEARYSAVGIKLVANRYKELRKKRTAQAAAVARRRTHAP